MKNQKSDLINKEDLRIVFMGTPDFAVKTLKKTREQGYNIVAVVTSQDKPAGRGKKIKTSPVKNYALEHNLNVLQPKNLKDEHFIQQLKNLNPHLQIVVAFRMLPEIVWQIPPMGTVNVHASILPQYRGAAPINWAIINGEQETGVTSFFIEKDIDTGEIIMQEPVKIKENETAGELHDKLMHKAADITIKTIEAIRNKTIKPIPQKKLLNNYQVLKNAPKIKKEDCLINWDNNSKNIYDFIRGLSPYPGAWTKYNDLFCKIFSAEIKDNIQNHEEPGTIITDNKSYIYVKTDSGAISIKEIQMEGKKRLITEEFLRGFSFEKDAVFLSS